MDALPDPMDLIMENDPERLREYDVHAVLAGHSLSFVVRSGGTNLVPLLLERGVDAEAGEDGLSPLLVAMECGEYATAEVLIRHGVNLQVRNREGLTVLHLAVESNRYNLVCQILNAGVSVDSRSNGQNTPLHFAVNNGRIAIAQLLINYGADVEARNRVGETPLDWAHTSIVSNDEMVALLEEASMSLIKEPGVE